MKAALYTKYGPPEVLHIREVEKPVPGKNEMLVKIYSTTVTAADVRLRSFTVGRLFWIPARIALGITKPRKEILGMDFAGEIEAAGEDVKDFKKGDLVFGCTGSKLGAYAEYVCIHEDSAVVIKPPNVSCDEIVGVPIMGLSALFFLRKAGVKEGDKTLINGASGAVGTFAVQIAKHFGANVTGVCSTKNMELVRSLGADDVIDYTKDDFTGSGEKYDVIFDVVGNSSFSRTKDSLKPKGLYITTVPTLGTIIQMLWTSVRGGKKALYGVAPERKDDLMFLKNLIETGKLQAVIDKSYPLDQIVEAHRYVDTGHKIGNVVINIK